MYQPPLIHQGRADRRHAAVVRRSRKRRRFAITVAVILLVLCMMVTGWFIYSVTRKKNPGSYSVTIPEGLTVKETARKVAKQCPISENAFNAAVKAGNYNYTFLEEAKGNLEGFLFPKTYKVTVQTSARQFVSKLLEQFHKETEDLDWTLAAKRGLNQYQVIIIASLIEKEAKAPDERPLIASVINNRLKANMKLQIDATVQYAIGNWKPVLSYNDLKVNSPYNTYVISGLPPAPICNPGFESIRAALYPKDTNYLYYILTSPEGRHSFTTDYQQFLKWKDEQNRKS